MANETLNASSSAYASCIASASIGTIAMSTEANAVAIGTALSTGSEDLYPLLDFKLKVTSGTVTAGDKIYLYRRPSDGTDQANIPAITSNHALQDYVDYFTLGITAASGASEVRYLFGIKNCHPDDEYYLLNGGGASITMQLFVRGSTYGN